MSDWATYPDQLSSVSILILPVSGIVDAAILSDLSWTCALNSCPLPTAAPSAITAAIDSSAVLILNLELLFCFSIITMIGLLLVNLLHLSCSNLIFISLFHKDERITT